jgi:putative ATP-dependent endonuclease of OLD family
MVFRKSVQFVQVFSCDTTFERELTMRGTLRMLEAASQEIGAPRAARQLRQARLALVGNPQLNLEPARNQVLRTAKRFGKARFAQIISKHAQLATTVPDYIQNALIWLTAE